MAELDAAVKRLDQSEGGKTAMVEQVCSYADHSKRVQVTSSSYMIGLTPKFKTKGLNNDSHDLHFKTKEAAAKRSNNSSCCFAICSGFGPVAFYLTSVTHYTTGIEALMCIRTKI